MRSHREIERSFAPGPDDQLPNLTEVDGVALVEEAESVDLSATYFDTEDLALTRAGVSLRRREGGEDQGWHLKIPADEGRDEIQQPLGRATHAPPAALRRWVLGWSAGRDLAPVASIETRRTTRNLRDTDGVLLAEVADDRVVGTPTDGADPVVWREWEVELVDAEPDLLTALGDLLGQAGAPPSPSQRKIERVLAPETAEQQMPDEDTAAWVLHRRLIDQVSRLRLHESGIRRGVPDSVHQTRVCCRRLRAALATYRPLVDRAVTDPIRDELRWVARTLSDARDAEVMHERLRGLVEGEPFVEGPVRRRLRSTYRQREQNGMRVGEQLLTSDRYFSLLLALERLVADPPWTEKAADDAHDVTRQRMRKERRRLRRRVEAALALEDAGGTAYDHAVHDVRKAAKRFRYACEAAEPVLGKDAAKLRKKAKKLTQVLGERQDTTVTRADLLTFARAATEEGESALTYGRLHAREEARAEELDREFRKRWEKLG
jgi:CHAD domain-containing protein